MKINFRGIVEGQKLPISAPLLPLFEAIVNSIQSIEEANIDSGEIKVNVIRDNTLFKGDDWETDVCSFEIMDNGVGFNEKNFASFEEYASDHKLLLGCKGIGRVSWLRAFSEVSVESTYLAEDGQYYDRAFNFTVAKEISDHTTQISSKTQPATKVVLENYAQKYKKQCPKRLDTLARDIMNHCFAYLALNACPRIVISDEQDSRCVNDLFNESTKGQLTVKEFEVGDNKFSIINAKNFAALKDNHTLHFCAHNREVPPADRLSSSIKGLIGKLSNEDGDFVYSGYITGALLDENINSERTDFTFAKVESSEMDADAENEEQLVMMGTNSAISKKDIINAAIPIIEEFLKDELQAYSEQRRERVENYVQRQNPRYRSLLKHAPDCLEKIPFTSDDEKLELELFKQDQAYRLSIKQEQKKFIAEDLSQVHDVGDYTEKRNSLMAKVSDLGKDDLAGYIIHRKVMLDILSRNLEYSNADNMKYALEKEVHNIVFPMGTTSDEIDYTRHNLWMIDERLAYHYYLASDKAISSYDVIKSSSGKEPDIAIFDKAFALTGDGQDSELNNITIIEFKRPGRTDKDCVDQVVDYIEKIREGKCKDRSGRIIAEMQGQNLRFTCYILCDMTAELSKSLEKQDYKKTPDGKSYYRYHETYNAYIEVLPYAKMVTDSKKRNKILFDTLFTQLPKNEVTT